MQDESNAAQWRTVRRRGMVLVPLIVAVSLFWVLMLLFTNLPWLALAVIALLSLTLLSVATAWTAMAMPRRDESDDAESR